MIDLRKELAAQKKLEYTHLTAELENVERQLYELEASAFKNRELRHLARLICTGATLVPSDSHEILKRGRDTINKSTFKSLEKKLEKKNAELLEVRDFRKKLDDKEKEICAEIEKLQNHKIEIIFAEIKKEVQTANLDVSSASILPVLEALRKNQGVIDLLQPDAEPPVTNSAATSQAPPAEISKVDVLASISALTEN